MSAAPNTVFVKIMDKEYQVACPPDQERALIEAARHLDKQMRTVRDAGKVIGLERIAVMVALNTTYELLGKGEASEGVDQAGLDQVRRLSDRIDDALQRFSQMEIG
ncbi:MAG: cell division protein ZapA [Spongiibacteraceae bacterium]